LGITSNCPSLGWLDCVDGNVRVVGSLPKSPISGNTVLLTHLVDAVD